MSRLIKNPYCSKKSKKYRAEVSVGSGIGRRRFSKTFDTKNDASKWIASKELAESKSGTFSNGSLCIADWCELWFEVFKNPFVSKLTALTYKSTIKILRDYLPTLKVKEISKSIVQNFINELSKRYAKETVRKHLTHMRQALDEAVDEGILIKNSAVKINIPKGKLTKSKEERIMSSEEYLRLIGYLNNQVVDYNNLNDMVIKIISNTAIRVSEALALTNDDIDFDLHVIRINKSYDRHTKTLKEPKTKNGIREVPIANSLVRTIKKWISKHGEILSQSNVENPKKLIFLKRDGNLPSSSTINARYHKIQKDLNFFNSYSIHTLRHYIGSKLLESGKVSVIYVANFLGHSTPSITQKYYAGIISDHKDIQHREALDIIASD